MNMTVSDLIQREIDIDVYDDVIDAINVAFCGPLKLTEEGMKKFGEVLDYPVVIRSRPGFPSYAIVCVGGKGWAKKLEKANDFFWSAAGYCGASDYDKWFKEV